MTVAFYKGRYGVRMAASDADLAACQALRHRCFFGGEGVDADAFDAACAHVMIAGDTGLIGTFRVMLLDSGASLTQTYAAQSYGLDRLATYDRPMLEMGRFCVDPSEMDADVLRLAWGALAQLVDDNDVAFMFGCASFEGVDPAAYDAAFGLLAARYLGPEALAPERLGIEDLPLVPARKPGAVQQLPPLLRTYLSMGGWVSDHAVIDRVMNTMHVFVGLEINKVPPARAKALRAITS